MKVVVYDENGKLYSVEAVDAREMIESGSYMREDPNAPAKQVKAPAPPAAPPASAVHVAPAVPVPTPTK